MLALRVDVHSWKLSLFNAAKPYDKRLPKMAEFLRKGTSAARLDVMLNQNTAKHATRNWFFFKVSFNE
jgi:hypothetical protein